MRWDLEILNPFGARSQNLLIRLASGADKSVNANGPARGIQDVKFNPDGSVLSAGGSLSFKAPMSIEKNLGIAPPNMVRLIRSDLGPVGTFIVTAESRSPLGADWATYTLPDITDELRGFLINGYASALTDDMQSTGTTLVQQVTDASWAFKSLLDAGSYRGTDFVADGITVKQGLGKLGSERFSSWRLAANRTIEMGRWAGIDSKIRLLREAAQPNAGTQTKRFIKDLQIQEDISGLINLIVPQGNGSGFTALTLETLFNWSGAFVISPPGGSAWYQTGPINFPDFNPNYTIYARPRLDYNITGKFQYFLADLASITRWRRREFPYPRTDITPIDGTLDRLQSAAQTLYQVTASYLQWHNDPNYVYSVKTQGVGDNRYIAGEIAEIDYDKVVDGTVTESVHAPFQIMGVESAIDNKTGDWEDTWNMSSQGQNAATGETMVTGALEAIDYWKGTPMIYPVAYTDRFTDYIDASNPISFVVPYDQGIISRASATIYVKLIPIRSPVSVAATVGHQHDYTIPALSVSIPALSVSIPAQSVSIPAQSVSIPPQGVAVSGGSHDTTHNAGAHTNSLPTASGGIIVGTKPFIDLKGVGALVTAAVGKNGETVVTDIRGTSSTADHTHGLSSGATGGASYSVAPSNGTYGGFNIGTGTAGTTSGTTGTTTATVATTAATTASTTASTATLHTITGGDHTHNLTFGIFPGPVPTNVFVFVDGQLVNATPINGTDMVALDVLAFLASAQDHTVVIGAATLGGVSVVLVERHRETTYKAG